MYEIEWSDQARTDFRSLPVFWRRQVTAAVAQLVHQAELETRNRKRLSKKIEGLTEAEWNLRIGDLRLLYRVLDEGRVQILRVILEGTLTIDDALKREKP